MPNDSEQHEGKWSLLGHIREELRQENPRLFITTAVIYFGLIGIGVWLMPPTPDQPKVHRWPAPPSSTDDGYRRISPDLREEVYNATLAAARHAVGHPDCDTLFIAAPSHTARNNNQLVIAECRSGYRVTMRDGVVVSETTPRTANQALRDWANLLFERLGLPWNL